MPRLGASVRAWCWSLLLALVLAPALGQMHRALHGAHGPAPAVLQANAPDRANTAQAYADLPAASLWAALFAGHSPADCQLLDQLTLGDLLHGAMPALVQAAPQAPLPVARVQHAKAQRLAAFHARAPPRSLAV